jgi:hypothetical protein
MPNFRAFAPATSMISILVCASGHAQQTAPTAENGGALEEIVVTAQKRSESANAVPMSISAFSGDDLRAQGIIDVGDLQKVVPGFSYTPSPYAVPIYSIRGIGFNESSLGAKPDVSVYVDEVPLAFPISICNESKSSRAHKALSSGRTPRVVPSTTLRRSPRTRSRPASMWTTGGSTR